MQDESYKKSKAEMLPDPVVCTVDVVLLTLREGSFCYALVPREQEPFQGVAALPGGFVHPAEDKDLRASAERVLRDKAGIQGVYLEQLAVFSGVARDPRGWSISVAWYTLVPLEALQAALATGVILREVADLGGLPFDHAEIVRVALERVRSKSTYSSLPVHLCPATFTLPQLQAVYETLLGEPINKVSFRRKMEELAFVEPIKGEFDSSGAHRPAQLYRLKAKYRSRLSLTDRGMNSGG